jgi:hypothetical protein
VRHDTKGLNSFTVNYLAKDVPKTVEVFAPNLKQALIQATNTLLKECGWEFIIVSIKQTSEVSA